MFDLPDIDEIVRLALAEDLGIAAQQLGAGPDPSLLGRDVTSSGVLGEDARFVGEIVARQECVVAGLPVAAAVFETLSESAGLFDAVEFFPLVAEGTRVPAGTAVASVDGLATAVLAAERTALDFLMVLSGIATETARWVAAADNLAVTDTRKTLPGLRALSKYAVRVGGGTNHREGLWDMALVKDNHLTRVRIADAVAAVRDASPGIEIEVEADTTAQAIEAVAAGADIVLLDNMDDATLAAAVAAVREAAAKRGRPCVTEASGGIRYERLASLAATGVDRVSSSAITLAPPVDFGFDEGDVG